MRPTRLLLLALLVAGIAAFFWFDLGRFLTVEAMQARLGAWAAYRDAHPVLTAGAFFAAYVAVAALSLPGAAVMTLAAGALFGLAWGTVLVSFASTIGATGAFLAARTLLREKLQGRYGEKLAAVNAGIARDGAFYLFAIRLVPLFPFFLVNLVMGLTALSARTFFWVSQLGMFPGTLAYVNAGTQLAAIRPGEPLLSPGLVGAFVLLGLLPLVAKRVVEGLRARRVYKSFTRPRRFDRNLIVIGAGAGGLVSAYIAAAVKAKVTLIERHRMGGDCLNTGCVPSKALLRAAKAMTDVQRAARYGIEGAGTPRADFPAVMARVREVIARIEPHDSVARYTKLGVECLHGEAKFLDPWTVQVGAQRLTAPEIVIATGGEPAMPPIPGLADCGALTSETIWNLEALPPRLAVLGGGSIGSELAQAFARLGSQVTLIEAMPRLLMRDDEAASALVQRAFERDGISLRLGTKVVAARREGETCVLVCERDGVRTEVACDVVLVAVGRRARLKGFGLEAFGIDTDAKSLEVNEQLQARLPNLYAAGDVAARYQLTHVAAHTAWYAAVNALFGPLLWLRGGRFAVDYSVVPWSTFTEPEVARVGLSEAEAREQKVLFEVVQFELDELDRAIADGSAEGFVKVLVAPKGDRILGATVVGERAGELIAEWTLAMRHGIGLNKLLGTIHTYPTLSESAKYAAGEWKRAHAPQGLLKVAERFHAWRRG